MSRYRPPSEKGSIYITAEGYARLRDEYDQLWRVRRPEVVRALATAAAEGDRSENAEYQYRKKELREIDRRVRYLQVRLPDLRVVDRAPDQPGRVFFGAQIEIADAGGETRRHRIVGPDEAGEGPGYISVDSPLARALLGKQEGEVFTVRLPGGETELEIISVSYA
ncbi:MAG: greB [Hydrocarboniphaga sp.]|uniref:transcription elongation factor GreB n=1 Tax=Hydrocarboniphaga sp. TaxID=2033016 RepID=UPI002633C210|nr:transcription elongation factor GreB [Hydrocarboniphaga sp.]MDB5971780.1 greB [Hydrocarboniphaga sp.]